MERKLYLKRQMERKNKRSICQHSFKQKKGYKTFTRSFSGSLRRIDEKEKGEFSYKKDSQYYNLRRSLKVNSKGRKYYYNKKVLQSFWDCYTTEKPKEHLCFKWV